ncbi:succinate dehydrogenase assembly factor 2 [Xylophilus sp. GOD-11R]|uniref:FAD assembly factor SdhE n=1 Tax=Xylophilus sp. GOD-11R TaxID=3089814 RepID=UPI00298BEC11|nr:succinate dehydrogenase assembly factor 2 [Xylophilus sp. GOD-11R]WPB58516.1 succinate dehydrogenase assembly factor 2 [Xylophilus sp. GOD-11R]
MQAVPDEALVDERSLSKLRWRCRRGLLENDLFIERFFARHADTLTVRQARGMTQLMDLSDHDLMDLLMGRKQPEGATATPEALDVLRMLRV